MTLPPLVEGWSSKAVPIYHLDRVLHNLECNKIIFMYEGGNNRKWRDRDERDGEGRRLLKVEGTLLSDTETDVDVIFSELFTLVRNIITAMVSNLHKLDGHKPKHYPELLETNTFCYPEYLFFCKSIDCLYSQ